MQLLIVDTDPQEVERRLQEGELACPRCSGELRPWWFARRRKLRDGPRDVTLRPRRAICRGCRATHVLLAAAVFVRRRDLAEVIGATLAVRAQRGWGHRRIARIVGVPDTTARGWIRAFAASAEPIRHHFTALAARLDPQLAPIEPRASPVADAFEAIAIADEAACRRLGEVPVWCFVSAATSGRLINNTNPPFPEPW